MYKLSTVNNQGSIGKVVKALGVQCRSPWFKCQLVLGCFFFFLGFFCNFNHISGTNASIFLLLFCNYFIDFHQTTDSMFRLCTCQFSVAYDKRFTL